MSKSSTYQKGGGEEAAQEEISIHDQGVNDTAIMKELRLLRSAGSSYISPELFERLYFSPQNMVKGSLRRTFGNPTPIGVMGFVMAVAPMSCTLMGWGGAGGNGVAYTGVFLFFSGPLMIISSILEFLLGNTFSSVVFMAYGGFSLAFAATLMPFYNAAGAFSASGTNTTEGLQSPLFLSSFAFFIVMMGVLNLLFLICSLRTSIVFFIMFLASTTAFFILSASYWQASKGHMASAHDLQVTCGALLFIAAVGGWYVLAAGLLASLNFAIQLPLGTFNKQERKAGDDENGGNKV